MKEKIVKFILDRKFAKRVVRDKLGLISYYFLPSGKSFYPTTIYLAVNSVCNLKCKMCDIGQQNKNSQFYKNLMKRGNLPIKIIKKLINEVKSFNPLIAITSTEPLLHPQIIKIISIIKKNGLQCQLTTNGFLLENFAEKIVKSGLDYLWISLDGPREIHDKIRGIKGSFDRAANGIKKAEYFKRKYNKKSPEININFVISNINCGYLSNFLDEIRKLEIKPNQILFSHMNFVTAKIAKIHNKKFSWICTATPSSVTILNPKKLNTKKLDEEIKKVKSSYKDFNISFVPDVSGKNLDIYYKHPEKFVTPKRCIVPWKNAQIQANGDCIPNTRCFNIVLGNINKNPFKEIWNGEKYKRFRKQLKLFGAFPACSRCCGIF
jgi:MoaA/NifB/PqqE/SkfB family radical SAM enzyme